MALNKKRTATKVATKKSVGKKAKAKDSQYFNQSVTTPKGILSYPTLSEPRVTPRGQDEYSCDIFVSKEEMLTDKGEKFMNVINECLEFYDIDQDDCEHFPVVDMDEESDCPDFAKGCYRIRAKNKIAVPTVIDRKKVNLTEDEVAKIKGGDIGKLLVSPYKYTFNGSDGIGLGLEVVMFIEAGDPLGGGSAARVSAIASMEVEELDDEDIEEDEVDSEEDDTEFED